MRACRTFAVLTFIALATATAAAQFPPLSSYGLVDRGGILAADACPCIRDPFTVPQFVPSGYSNGPAALLESDTLRPQEKQMLALGYADDRANLQTMAAAALAGSGNDSFGVAMHLALQRLVSGKPNAEIEEQTSRWFHLAAQQGHDDSFVRLAYRYRHGLGAPKDDGAAAYWTYQGAIRGESLAMVAMGLTYASGRGVPQDWTAAFQWWQRAASKNALATRFMGDAYVCGLGVVRNYDRAVEAYADAVKRGEMSANIRLGDLYAAGCATGSEDAALKAYTAAADRGYPEAQVALSELLRLGRGTDPDAYSAYRLSRLAERRLPDGTLKTLASERARAAASLLSEFLIADADKMVDGMLTAARR
jgi:TPR repeat protein